MFWRISMKEIIYFQLSFRTLVKNLSHAYPPSRFHGYTPRFFGRRLPLNDRVYVFCFMITIHIAVVAGDTPSNKHKSIVIQSVSEESQSCISTLHIFHLYPRFSGQRISLNDSSKCFIFYTCIREHTIVFYTSSLT